MLRIKMEDEMHVRLIDYTGAGQSDPADYAAKLLIYTKNTRLTQGQDTQLAINALSIEQIDKELNAIARTIRSSHEFVDYTWEITGVTRAYTHQAVRTRTASYAQQTMRSTDMSGFDSLCPDSVKAAEMDGVWRSCMQMIASTYKMLKDADVPSEDARGVLPTNVLTNIIVKMNLRSFADLVGKRTSLRAQGEYAKVVELNLLLTCHL
jgi:flavin-dependent thymidylate synthase